MPRGHRIASVLTVIVVLATIVAGVRAGDDVDAGLRAAAFTADVTPALNEPIGLGFIAFAKTIEHPLLAKGVTQIYFTGCGGDVAMGKYNDGTPKARQALTDRLHDAMQRSIADVRTEPISNVRWEQAGIAFVKRRDPEFQRPSNVAMLANARATPIQRLKAGINLAWIKRGATRPPIEMSCLTIDGVRILHLPGEPFVQYQLAAQKMQRDAFVVVAGYGDCGMGYIGGDRIFTDRGGYEQTYSFAGPSQGVMLETMERLLEGAD